MKSKYLLRIVSLLALLVSLFPASNASAVSLAEPPPTDMFQLPWDLGAAWVAIDGIDNGTRRPLNSSHHYSVGGAIDFAPHNNMRKGEDTSRFWVTAAASGTVTAKSFCHVKIDHGNGWTSEYQFLGNIQVKTGDSVSRNQRLGVIADGVRQRFCPGSSEPNVPHLHFMLRPSLRNATLAGWEINYLPILSKTTFRKNGQTLGLFKPLLNAFDAPQIVSRGALTWDTLYLGTVDAYRYERWSLTLAELSKFTLTAMPTTSGLTPLILLLDANGSEIARNPGTLTSTQPAGNYFVQIQPEAGSGSYTLLAQKDELPVNPYVSTTVTPSSVSVGQAASATVSLTNLPAEGYSSAEFTCTYNQALTEVSNIAVTDLFGEDPAVAINGPQNGSFIVAVAGSKGSKATTNGATFTFSLKGLHPGQMTLNCQARVSTGDNALTAIESVPGSINITGVAVTPASPTVPVESPEPTFTPSTTPPTQTTPPAATPTDTPRSTSTVLPSACDRAEFIGDITIPNGTTVTPSATFIKTWRLKNLGPCVWTTSYQLVFFSGEPMGTTFSAQLPQNVGVGQTVDISINLTAPNAPGTYRGYWMFQNTSGAFFGIGPDANQPWSVEIAVAGPTLPPSLTPSRPPASATPTGTPDGPTATPIPGTVYDFTVHACEASWFSGAGQLPCPGTDGDPKGFVLKLLHPRLESGAIDERPGLITFPQNAQDGYIQGFYPAFRVQNGDRFRSTIACEYGAISCYLAFRLDYQVGTEPIRTFWGPFLERYDGQYYSMDVDLSSLAGKDVKFILTVLSAGQATGDRALWVGPVIVRANQTSTATPTPTTEISPTPVTPTEHPDYCEAAELIADVTIPNGTVMGPGESFTKTWRVKNVGTCTWTTAYQLIPVGGDEMGTSEPVNLPANVAPGQTVDLSITFTSPTISGHFQGFWKFRNDVGSNQFGIGPSAVDPLVVDIVVPDSMITPSPTSSTPMADWLPYRNGKYNYEFFYPKDAQIVSGDTNNYVRINLPFVRGTNLGEKYLQVTVAEDANPCRSPLASSSIPQSSETVVINGITFLKETGEDGSAGHIHPWTAYSTSKANVCISMDFVMRVANPGAFATPPPLYDKAAESVVFGQIVSTFHWLDTSTATPTEPFPSVTPTATGVPDNLTGKVFASKPVTVSLYDANNAYVGFVTANPDGSFRFNAAPGIYTIRANANGFLRAEGSVTIPETGTATKPDLRLLAGDIDGNDVIDQFDALTIGMNYNSAAPSDADLNNDGVINVLDLELLAGNYRKSAPQVWN